MFKVSTKDLLGHAGGKYTLLEMVFQRTRKTTSKKNGIIALQEIAEGKVRLAPNEEDEPEPAK